KMAEMLQTAVGFTEERGDQFSLQSAPFIVQEAALPEPSVHWWDSLAAWESYIRYALGTLLLFLLIIFGIRPLVKHLTRRTEPSRPVRDGLDAELSAMLEGAPAGTARRALAKAPARATPEEET